MEYLRFEMSAVRERIVEANPGTLAAGANTSSFTSVTSNFTSLVDLEDKLNENVSLLAELSIKGAQCYQKTVHVLVQASFAASAIQSRQNSTSTRRDQIENELREFDDLKKQKSDEVDAQKPEVDFLDVTLQLVDDAAKNLNRSTSTNTNDTINLNKSQVSAVPLPGPTATEVRRTLATLSSELGAIPRDHRSGVITNNLDQRVLAFLQIQSGGGVDLSLEVTTQQLLDMLGHVEEAQRDLNVRRGELQVYAAERKAEINSIQERIREKERERQAIIATVLEANQFDFLACPGQGLVQTTNGAGTNTSTPLVSAANPGTPVSFTQATTCKADASLTTVLPVWTRLPVSCWLSPILTMPSGLLYSICVVFSGAIGSVFAAFYFRYPDIVARMFPGLVAGMIALLVIKGGKFLFILDFGIITPENPYSGALAGMLAGLFTERGFKLIEHLIDSGIDRITSEESNGPAEANGAAAPGNGGPPKPDKHDDDGQPPPKKPA